MHVTLEDLKRFNKPLPRYTSYPTAPQWSLIEVSAYEEHLKKISAKPISLYLHIPFCETMCLYCGCAVILNRKPENEERYVQYLLKEIELVKEKLQSKHLVKEVHFGGGTPTKLTSLQLGRIMQALHKTFSIEDADISIEIDPRTVFNDEGKKLKEIKNLGFNRVSFGVQDSNERVQEAIRRRQSFEMTRKSYFLAKELGFFGINIDLIYGLPFQTAASFHKTVEDIIDLRPDRIALFSYAKVPWLKPHQKAIKEETLPSFEEKFQIYLMARELFIASGYQALGMDHFGLEEDRLTKAYFAGKLHRNFQGYTLQAAEEMVSFGLTAIGEVAFGYFQNAKELNAYYEALDCNQLPIAKGVILTEEDRIRKWVIKSLMCQFVVDKNEFEERFGYVFDAYFHCEINQLKEFINEGMLVNKNDELKVEGKGRLFVRNLSAYFDAYLQKEEMKRRFSSAI